MTETTEDLMYRSIKNTIRHGHYLSGMRRVPASLATEFGVSLVLRKLATEGFFSSLPNRRLAVIKINLTAMKEIFEIHAVLEGLTIRLSMGNMNPGYKNVEG